MMTKNFEPVRVIDYAGVHLAEGEGRRPVMPWWIALGSLLPVPLLVIGLYTKGYWSRWFQLGQGWERVFGIWWMATAAFSLVCLIALGYFRKRWYAWIALALHLIFVSLTVLPPGCLMIAWLMHWPTGAPD